MKFSEIAALIEGVPYTSPARGKILYDHIIKGKNKNCLELGFAHGVASCYIAAALHELGSGMLTCVDLESSVGFEPNIEALLDRAGLQSYVTIHREVESYTWFLKKEIEKNSTDYQCRPLYDFCFIDGPKNWATDGFAFFLVEKLLTEGSYVLFDDYLWKYSTHAKKSVGNVSTQNLPEDQLNSANIELVFQLLVIQHPNFNRFVIDGGWAWARKDNQKEKSLTIIHGSKHYDVPLDSSKSLADNQADIIAQN